MLTEPQRLALTYLAGGGVCTPSGIGYAMGETTAKRYKAQVQGRRGATMGNRLVDMGFATISWRSGWGKRYAITKSGRKALAETPTAPAEKPSHR